MNYEESAKLPAPRAIRLLCPTYSRAPCASYLMCSCALRALCSTCLVLYVLSCLTYLVPQMLSRASSLSTIVPCVPRILPVLAPYMHPCVCALVSRVPHVLRALVSHVSRALCVLVLPYASCSHVPCASCFLMRYRPFLLLFLYFLSFL